MTVTFIFSGIQEGRTQMQHLMLNQFERVVAIGGGHGLAEHYLHSIFRQPFNGDCRDHR